MQSEKVNQLIEAFFDTGGKSDADILPMLGTRLAFLTTPEIEAVISAIILRLGPLEKKQPLAQAA